jgi:hypothetical protein
MNHDSTTPVPAGDLAARVAQTLGELAAVSDELNDGGPVRPSLASRCDTLAGDLRRAAEIIRQIPAKAPRS